MSTTAFQDDFTGSAGLLTGHAPNVGGAYASLSGSMTLDGAGHLTYQNVDDGPWNVAIAEAGRSDGTITLGAINTPDNGYNGGVMFRAVDNSNYWWARLDQAVGEATLSLIKKVGGTSSTLTTVGMSATFRNSTLSLTIILNGSNIQVTENASGQVINATDSALATATKLGYQFACTGVGVPVCTADNMLFVVPDAAAITLSDLAVSSDGTKLIGTISPSGVYTNGTGSATLTGNSSLTGTITGSAIGTSSFSLTITGHILNGMTASASITGGFITDGTTNSTAVSLSGTGSTYKDTFPNFSATAGTPGLVGYGQPPLASLLIANDTPNGYIQISPTPASGFTIGQVVTASAVYLGIEIANSTTSATASVTVTDVQWYADKTVLVTVSDDVDIADVDQIDYFQLYWPGNNHNADASPIVQISANSFTLYSGDWPSRSTSGVTWAAQVGFVPNMPGNQTGAVPAVGSGAWGGSGVTAGFFFFED